MNKKIYGIAAVVLIFAIIGGYLYYSSVVTAEELEKRNKTVYNEVKSYFNDLNIKNGDNGKDLGYIITSIKIGNVTEVSANEIKVPISVTVYSNDPGLKQDFISKSKKVWEGVEGDVQGPKYLSTEYISAVSFYESWEAVFIKNQDQWKLESMNKLS